MFAGMVLNGKLPTAQHSKTIYQLYQTVHYNYHLGTEVAQLQKHGASCPVIRAQVGNHATPAEGCFTPSTTQQQRVRGYWLSGACGW